MSAIFHVVNVLYVTYMYTENEKRKNVLPATRDDEMIV